MCLIYSGIHVSVSGCFPRERGLLREFLVVSPQMVPSLRPAGPDLRIHPSACSNTPPPPADEHLPRRTPPRVVILDSVSSSSESPYSAFWAILARRRHRWLAKIRRETIGGAAMRSWPFGKKNKQKSEAVPTPEPSVVRAVAVSGREATLLHG
jgi:hypothetical protein